MPLLKIQTNAEMGEAQRTALMREASQGVASLLGKSENYVMVSLEAGRSMVFAGTADPLAYLELKSIGLPESATADISKALCELVTSATGIASDRIYIEFTDAPRKMWGWNGGTF